MDEGFDHERSICTCKKNPKDCPCACDECFENRSQARVAKHDQEACLCEASLTFLRDSDSEEDFPPEKICPCQCGQCFRARHLLRKLLNALALERRLLKAGIDPQTMADLLLAKIQDVVEGRIDWLVQEAVERAVERALKGLTLYTKVSNYRNDH